MVFDVGQVLLRFEPDEFIPRLLPPGAARVLTKEVLFTCPTWSRIDEGTISEEACARKECADIACLSFGPRRCM